jgi:hypothetical protein
MYVGPGRQAAFFGRGHHGDLIYRVSNTVSELGYQSETPNIAFFTVQRDRPVEFDIVDLGLERMNTRGPTRPNRR